MSGLADTLRDDTTEVLQVLMRYLEGRHYGDAETLRSVVVAWTGDPRSPRRAHPDWLAPTNPAPADQGEPFNYEILDIDVDGDYAFAVLSCASLSVSHEAVALLRAKGAWYIDASCASDIECRP